MSTFHFRLATLLRIREAHRDDKRAELAEALRADAVLEEHLASIAQDLAKVLAEATKTASPGKVNIDRLLDAQRYELLLRAEEKIGLRQREQLAQEIERRRLALVEADREVRVLEKVRELQQARHREAEEWLEQAQMDEIAIRRFATRVSHE